MNFLLAALLLLAALASLLTAAMARELHSSDPAGNGLAQAYFAVTGAATWLLVLVVLAITGLREPHAQCPAAPWRTIGLVATVLLAVAIAGQFATLRWLFEAGNRGAMRTVLQCGTAAVPLSFVLFAAWRGIGLPLPMGAVLWGCAAVVGVGSALPFAMLLARATPRVAPLTITVDNLAYPALLLDGRKAVQVLRYADDLRAVGSLLPNDAGQYLLVDANCTTYALHGGATVTMTRQGALDIAALRTRLLELGPLHPDPAEDARIRHLVAMQPSVSALSFVLPH